MFSAELIAGCDLNSARSVVQIYDALWRRRVTIGSMTSPMVVSELGLTESDYQWLCRWARRFPEDYYERHLIRQTLATFRFHDTDLSMSRAIGLILAVTFAEHLRREGLAENASAWPVLRKLFSDEAERVLFIQRQPCDGLKQAVKDGLTHTGFGFLHRFDEEKTQQWFSTLTAQYGLSKPEIAEIRSLLVQPGRTALEYLIARLPSFGSFWQKLKEIRASLVSSADAREYLKASPFIPIGCAEGLLANLRGPRARAEGGGLAVGATQDASGLIARWKLVWNHAAGPSVEIVLDAESIAAALPGEDDVLVTMNGKFWAKLLRDDGVLHGVVRRTMNSSEMKPTLTFRVDSGGAASEESIALAPDVEDVVFFDAVSGKPVQDLQSLDPARAWICFCRSDLTLSCPALKFPTSEGWAAHYIEAGEIRGAVLCDVNGLEVWSHVTSAMIDAPRPSAPLIKVEPVNAGEYLAVDRRATLRLRVIGEGEVRSVRIAGMPYVVRKTGTGVFVDDVLLGANLRSRDVPFRYVVQRDERALVGSMNVALPMGGALIERDGVWLPLFKRDIFAAENADEQRFRFLHGFDGPGVLYNGHRYLQTCVDVPARLIRGLDGLGEDLTLRSQAFNQDENCVRIAYACVRSGLIGWVEMREDGEYLGLKLRRPNDLIGCSLVLWSARSGLRIMGDEDMVSHDEAASQNFEVALPDGFGKPDVLALAYRGELLGSWCFSENEVWQTPPAVDVATAREWAAFFRWCRLPFNWNIIAGFFGEFLRSDPLIIDALFSAVLPDGLRLTPTIHGDDVMERSLRYFIDRSFSEFREWMHTPGVAQVWRAQPERYRRLARVHPLLVRTVYQTLTGSWPTAQPNWEIFEESVRPQLRERFGDELDKRYLESAIEKWLAGESESSAEIHALLCEESFASWIRAGWAQPN
ncbi:MAG: hypothetical protein NTZ50_03790 [Chloroflexi bacterium]|nr:hypothetical protein [Chloroflexota bacterium]